MIHNIHSALSLLLFLAFMPILLLANNGIVFEGIEYQAKVSSSNEATLIGPVQQLVGKNITIPKEIN